MPNLRRHQTVQHHTMHHFDLLNLIRPEAEYKINYVKNPNSMQFLNVVNNSIHSSNVMRPIFIFYLEEQSRTRFLREFKRINVLRLGIIGTSNLVPNVANVLAYHCMLSFAC